MELRLRRRIGRVACTVLLGAAAGVAWGLLRDRDPQDGSIVWADFAGRVVFLAVFLVFADWLRSAMSRWSRRGRG